jgi:hypothetical protein
MNTPKELKPAAWGAVGGAIVLAILGFTWGGWMTGGGAAQAAKASADTAVIAALAPICAMQFHAQPDAAGKLAELKALRSYEQAGYVEKGGWATMPGSKDSVSGVAGACTTILTTST